MGKRPTGWWAELVSNIRKAQAACQADSEHWDQPKGPPLWEQGSQLPTPSPAQHHGNSSLQGPRGHAHLAFFRCWDSIVLPWGCLLSWLPGMHLFLVYLLPPPLLILSHLHGFLFLCPSLMPCASRTPFRVCGSHCLLIGWACPNPELRVSPTCTHVLVFLKNPWCPGCAHLPTPSMSLSSLSSLPDHPLSWSQSLTAPSSGHVLFISQDSAYLFPPPGALPHPLAWGRGLLFAYMYHSIYHTTLRGRNQPCSCLYHQCLACVCTKHLLSVDWMCEYWSEDL